MQACNHPKRGSIIKVEPICNSDDIGKIKKILQDKPRDSAIFILGINTNLRASDLLRIKVGQIRYLRPGEDFIIREKKTGKHKNITLNKAVHEAIQRLLHTMNDAEEDDYLFQSRKGKGPISVPYLNSLVKSWCKEINLMGNYGSHTLRKTLGYIHRTVFQTDMPTLMTIFNHSSQQQTLSYLCVQPDKIQDAYMKEIG